MAGRAAAIRARLDLCRSTRRAGHLRRLTPPGTCHLSRDRGHAPAADRQPISGLAFMSRQVSRLRSDLPHNSPSARLSTCSTCSSSGPTSPKTCNFAGAGAGKPQVGLAARPASRSYEGRRRRHTAAEASPVFANSRAHDAPPPFALNSGLTPGSSITCSARAGRVARSVDLALEGQRRPQACHWRRVWAQIGHKVVSCAGTQPSEPVDQQGFSAGLSPP